MSLLSPFILLKICFKNSTMDHIVHNIYIIFTNESFGLYADTHSYMNVNSLYYFIYQVSE